MLVEELDVTVVDTAGNLLADLVRATALNHVELGPSVLSLRAGGGTDEEVVLELTLEVVLLDMVGESSGNLPESAQENCLLASVAPRELPCVHIQ